MFYNEFDINKTMLENKIESFKTKPTWEQARDIWLSCEEEGYPVPPEIQEYFVNKLTADNTAWIEKRINTLKNKKDSHYIVSAPRTSSVISSDNMFH